MASGTYETTAVHVRQLVNAVFQMDVQVNEIGVQISLVTMKTLPHRLTLTRNALHVLRKSRVEGCSTRANFTNTKIDLVVKKINSSLTNGAAEFERKKKKNAN